VKEDDWHIASACRLEMRRQAKRDGALDRGDAEDRSQVVQI
jgi:hypothetical protein